MALKIRLSRGGAKKRPYYRIVVAEARSPRDGRFIEKVGSYDPLQPKGSDARVTLDGERIQYWMSKGAKPTDRVHRFLDDADILKRAPRNNPQKALPGKKAQERLEAARQAEEDAKEAAAAAEEEAAAAQEAPAEEAPTEEAAAEADAPVEDAPAEETAAEADAPAEDAPAEEAPAAEDAPAEETKADA